MAKLESEGNPVCAVWWPDSVGKLWAGIYGTAKIMPGSPAAVLASGEVVPL